jgi:hypothetical protein
VDIGWKISTLLLMLIDSSSLLPPTAAIFKYGDSELLDCRFLDLSERLAAASLALELVSNDCWILI